MDELITITLTHLEGPRTGEADAFSQPSIIVGRSPDSHLPFASEKGVSGRHAEIVQSGGRFEVVDHNSTNGTFVNEERVTRRVLAPGDKVRFGYMGPVLQVDWDAPRPAAAPAPAAPPVEQYGTVFIQADQLQAAKPAAPAAPSPRPAAPVAAPVAAAPVAVPIAAVAAAAPVAARPVVAAAPIARPAAVESSMAAAASTAAPAAAAPARASGGSGKYILIVLAVILASVAIVGGTAWFVLNR